MLPAYVLGTQLDFFCTSFAQDFCFSIKLFFRYILIDTYTQNAHMGSGWVRTSMHIQDTHVQQCSQKEMQGTCMQDVWGQSIVLSESLHLQTQPQDIEE